MASEVDIYNLGLSHLGEVATIADPNEQSVQAEQCRMFYPMARDTALELGEWDFATRRVSLALIDSPPPSSWAYAYALPAACLKARAVFDTACDENDTKQFIIESNDDGVRILYTNQVDAVLRYTAKVTDTTQFSPLFTDAVSFLLTSYLAGPILKGEVGIAAGRAAYGTFTQQIANAKGSAANQQQQQQSDQASAISARRGYPANFPCNVGDR